MRGISVSASSPSFSFPTLDTFSRSSSSTLVPLSTHLSLSSNPNPISLRRFSTAPTQCSKRPGFNSSGESDSRTVLDAFFLGKALAEAVNERIESTVGEFLSVLGQWQAEQRKQVQDLQEEVFERAKKAKEKAALETMEAQGIVLKSPAASDDGTTPTSPPSLGTSYGGDPFINMMKD